MTVRYEFRLDDRPLAAFDVDPDRKPVATGDLPPWTRLEAKQCPNCPLSPADSPRCPPAVDVREIAAEFAELLSYQEVEVRVVTEARTYVRTCSVETGLGSLLGLVMATSGCPRFRPLRPMAAFHLPFYQHEETLLRTVGFYLTRQLLAARDGEEPDWELAGLARIYGELAVVNQAFQERLEAASKRDANLNAVMSLFVLGSLVSMSLDDGLEELARFFRDDDRSG